MGRMDHWRQSGDDDARRRLGSARHSHTNHSKQETAMSKGQRGNKEVKKPKKALPPLGPAGPASVPAGTKSPDPIKKK